MEFYVTRLDFVVIINGCPNHIEPVELMKQSLAGFKWVLRRDHHPYLAQVGGFGHDICNDQMADVNGIERAEEESYFQSFRYLN